MAKFKFYRVYTNLVEHYLRQAVRYEHVGKEKAQDWHKFTKTWLSFLPDEDREFLQFVFSIDFHRTDFALYEYVGKGNEELPKPANYDLNRNKLYELERQFAVHAGLIGEGEFYDGSGEES